MRVLSVLIVLVLAALAVFAWLGRPHDVGALIDDRPTHAVVGAESTPLDDPNALASRARAEVADAAASPTAGIDPKSAAIEDSGPRCRVFGRVVAEDARPIPDVALSLSPAGGRPWSTRASLPKIEEGGRSRELLRGKTSLDGTFEFTAPLPTVDRVVLSMGPSEYFALADLDIGAGAGRDRPPLVEGDNDLGDIVLPSCGAIQGLVRSADGAPIAGAFVSALSSATTRRSTSVVSDASGRFTLGHVAPGSNDFDVRKEGWTSASNVKVEVRAGETTQVADVVLARAAEIRGIVVDQAGRPVAGVRIVGWPQRGGQSARATTNDDGTFTVQLPQNEPYTFEINRAKEYEPWGGMRSGPDFTFAPGTQNVRIVLTRALSVTFRVVDAVILAPIETFGIALDEKLPPGTIRSRFTRGAELEMHAGGTVVMPASAAKHDVLVRADGYAPYEGPIVLDSSSNDTVTIALERASSLRGRLLRSADPATKVEVTLQRDSMNADGTPYEILGAMGSSLHHDLGTFAGRARSVVSDDAGRFEFDGLSHGTYALTVKGTGVAEQSWRTLSVPKGGIADLGDLQVGAEAVIHGRLLTPVGVSPIGYTVTLGDLGLSEATISRVDGTFELSGLAAGTYVLNWNRPGENGFTTHPRSPRAIDVVLTAGEVRELTIDTTLFEPSTVRVRVLRGGRPAAGAMVRGEVHARGDSQSRRFTNSSPPVDAEGWAQFQVDGGSHFDVVVIGRDQGPPLAVVPNLDAVAGSIQEHVIEIRSGMLTLELPEALAVPQETWSLRVVLARPQMSSLTLYANAAKAPLPSFGVRPWTGARVEMGEVPAGTYEATVHFTRTEETGTEQRRRVSVPLREPFTTTITVEDAGTTRLVVP